MTGQPENELQGLRVAVVEDDQAMRLLLKSYLEQCGFDDIAAFADASGALKDLRRRRFDLVLSDISMQPTDGWDLLQAIRQSETSANPYVPVILVSQHADQKSVLRARDSGASGFVVKPLDMDNLKKTIIAVLNDRHAFVRSDSYSGPDRRRRDKLPNGGRYQRQSDYIW